ncbi:MAG: hypothetical protein ACM36C_11725 [Acidobacteriota bacterium]
MRTIKTTTGADLQLDGDLLALLETLYREVTLARDLDRSFEDMVREIQHVINSMDDEERKQYLAESLFRNTGSHANERLRASMRKRAEAQAEARGTDTETETETE